MSIIKPPKIGKIVKPKNISVTAVTPDRPTLALENEISSLEKEIAALEADILSSGKIKTTTASSQPDIIGTSATAASPTLENTQQPVNVRSAIPPIPPIKTGKKKADDRMLPPMDTTLDEETIQNALGLEKLFGFQDPGLRLLQSPSVNSRRFFQQIAEVPFKLKKNWKNIPTEEAAESRIKGVLDGRVASAVYQNNMAFKKYKQRMQGDLAKDRLSKKDFDKNVAYAIRRGLKSDIPEVLESASFFHKNIYKYVAEEGGKIKGFFDADDIEVLFKKPYLNRIYDTNQVLKNSSKFVGKAAAWLKREAATSKSPAKKAALEYVDTDTAVNADFFMQPAQSIMRNVVGARTMALQNRIGITSGPKSLKGRKFTIDDLDIEEFLESDINTLARVYAGSMFPRLELARRFGVDFLDDTFTEAKSEPVKAIRKEYADEISKVIDNPKKVDKLLKQEEKDITDLLAVRDRLLGSYGASANPSSWLHRVPRMIKQLNVLRMLGSATAAAVSDVARLVGINGATYAFKDGLVPLLKLASSPEGRAYFSKYKSELRAFNIGTELLMNNLREKGISGLAEEFAKNTKVERGLDVLTSQFMNYSLVGHWNTAFKTLAAMVIQNNVHRAISKVVSGKIKPKELAKLNSIGIDTNLAKQIYAQVQKHGTDFKGLVMPNVADWDEGFGELGEMYASAIKKEADIVILTPGVATTPLWMSRGGLGLLGQFKSFALSSVQKTIIPMAQNRDFVTAQAMLGLVGMGIVSGFLKAAISGKDFSTEPKQLIVEGVDRSGITAWVFDADHMIEAASGNRFGLSHVFGTAPVARYAQRGRLESILGPTGKLASDAMIVTGDILSGDVRQSTTSKFRQMLPYQNWFGTRIMLDKMEEEFNNSMGITKK